LRRPRVEDYNLAAWILAILLGGAYNIAALQIFVDRYLSPAISLESHGLAAAIVFIVVPIMLSVLLTKLQSEKRIVPPSYMQVVLVVWFVVSGVGHIDVSYLLGNTILSLYAIAAGLFQDSAARFLLGRTGQRDDIILGSLRVNADAEEIKAVFLSEGIRENLGLSSKVQETSEGSILRTPSDSGYQTILQVTRSRSGSSIISMAFLEMTRFSTKRSSRLDEYGKRQIAYLRDLFSREERSICVVDAPLANAQSLCSLVLREMQGMIEELGISAGIKILVAAAFLVIPTVLYYDGKLKLQEWLGLLLPICLFLISQLPTRLGRGTGRSQG